MTSVLLIDPKHAHNVGGVLRASALLGAQQLFWTGDRVPDPETWPAGARLPREERMRCYKRTTLSWLGSEAWHADEVFVKRMGVPVCVEIGPMAEDLRDFQHPASALYVFGPEDGSIPKVVRMHCHRFVRIPNALPVDDPDSRTPYNLSAAVNIVLFDRLLKSTRAHIAVASVALHAQP